MLGRMATDFVVDATTLAYPVFQARESVLATDVWLQRADGQISCQSITAVPIYDPEGLWCGTRGMGRDVTELRERERTQKQRVLRDRLMTYLADTIRNEINPGKDAARGAVGHRPRDCADGGLIINGHPASSGYDVVTGARRCRMPISRLRWPVLVEQGFHPICCAVGLQLIGNVTEDARRAISASTAPSCSGAMPMAAASATATVPCWPKSAGQVGLAIAQLRNYREIVTRPIPTG
ncbi:MAG: hypothetical protein WDN69_09385 [Aliidongia sp.]